MPISHTIQDGDSVIRLSDQHGFFATTIWNDAANADLRSRRTDMNVLLAGDVVVIPDKRPKERPAQTGRLNVYRRRGIPAVYRLQLFDIEEPRANQEYRLTVDGEVYRGTTDQDGKLEEHLPATARQGELVIGSDEFRLRIKFGHLDPIHEVSGVQKRLINLGYDCGAVEGELGPRTEAALLMFQERFEMEKTGRPDEATVAKLEEIHDEVNEFPDEPDHASGAGS